MPCEELNVASWTVNKCAINIRIAQGLLMHLHLHSYELWVHRLWYHIMLYILWKAWGNWKCTTVTNIISNNSCFLVPHLDLWTLEHCLHMDTLYLKIPSVLLLPLLLLCCCCCLALANGSPTQEVHCASLRHWKLNSMCIRNPNSLIWWRQLHMQEGLCVTVWPPPSLFCLVRDFAKIWIFHGWVLVDSKQQSPQTAIFNCPPDEMLDLFFQLWQIKCLIRIRIHFTVVLLIEQYRCSSLPPLVRHEILKRKLDVDIAIHH